MKILMIQAIRGYQLLISPMLGTRCRFHPSCSCYAMEAIEKKGFFHGIVISTKRLLKCHPFHRGGFDPVSISESDAS